ncbi:hypothetical protein AB2M62_15645 [Sphingomonas sp. MMS12-HWE2-04]|uniref:hypothetical protein n=1 Tax=Sphingomonas sp. MMS12-HWE2-04 TaxID=3234199 RepID=UPI0038507AFF
MTQREDDLIRGRASVTPPGPIDHTEMVRARQRSRARVMALLLGSFVVLIFAISIVKIAQGYGP